MDRIISRKAMLGVAMLAVAATWLTISARPAHAQAAEPTCEQVLIPMSDGTRLHGWIRHGAEAPADAGPRPVVWQMTPYTNTGCAGAGSTFGIFDQEMIEQVTLARVSYRGTGASEGPQDAWGPGDRTDVTEVGNWLASQPWADGLVPTGASAEGAWITFAVDHPAVKASVWITSCADGYRACVRSGGQLAGGGFILTAGELQGYAQGLALRYENGTYSGDLPADFLTGIAGASPAFTEDTNGAFWDSRLGFEYVEQAKAPILFTTDLYDYVSAGMYLAYEHAPPKLAYLNTGLGHNGHWIRDPQASNLETLIRDDARDFVRHFVFDQKKVKPPARLRLQTNTGTVSGYERGETIVRDEADWPLPKTKWTRLYLDGEKSGSAQSLNDGSLSLEAPAAAATDPAPLATVNGPKGELRTLLAVFGAADSAAKANFGQEGLEDALTTAFMDDLTPEENAALTYTTPPLAEDTEISGPVVLQVRASATAPSFDWQVRMTDVHPDGRSSWITDGQLRATLRRVNEAESVKNRQGDYIRPWLDYKEHEQVPIGEPVDYVIELAPTSNVFRQGHRIRLDIQPIASGYMDSGRTGGVGALQVERGGVEPSRLVLPVIPRRCQKSALGSDAIEPVKCGRSLTVDGG